MKNFKITRKILALLLSLSLITGMMPAMAWDAFAAESTIVDSAVIMSDLHTTSSNNKSSTVTGVLQAIKKDVGRDASTVTSAGDMFSVNASNYDCNTNAITTAIKSVYPDAQVDYVWSDHDRTATEISKESRLVYGTGDNEKYYIYLLSMADLSSNDRYNAGFFSSSEITSHIEEFKATAATLDKTKPLFIVGHQPLFHDRGDNGYAYQWVTAINEVASTMDVAYFHGHNHNYDEASNYYYAKNTTMSVPKLSGTNLQPVNVTLKFTHVNAGYMSPSTGNSGNTRMGTAMAVTIYDNSINYTTYDSSGEYTDSFALNVDVERDFEATPVTKSLDSISITTPPTKTEYTVGEDFDAAGMIVTAKYSDNSDAPVTGYTVSEVDMTTAGTKTVTVTYTEGTITKEAEFTIKVNAKDEESGDTEEPEDKDVVLSNPTTASGEGQVTTTAKRTVYVLTSSISDGNSYLIANSNSAGTANLLANNNGSVVGTSASVKSGDLDGNGKAETYIELDDATDELWATSGSGNHTFKNGNHYLGYTTSGSNWNTTYTFGLSTTSRTWSYSSSNNRLSTSVGNWYRTTYYLQYSSGWKWTESSSASGTNVYFYVPTEIDVESTTTVKGTYSIAAEDVSLTASNGTTANLTSTLTFKPESGAATTTDVSTTATYEIVTVDAEGNKLDNNIISGIKNGVVTFNGNYGKAYVKVSYDTEFGKVTNYITVEAKAPYYTIQLHNPEEGVEITKPVALKNVKAGDTYSVWAVVKKHDANNPGGVDMGSLGNQLSWTVSDESIATINTETGVITFTGENFGTFTVTVSYKGDDEKVVRDTITISATDSPYIVPGDGTNDFPEYPNEGAVRFDKTATAVGNFSETGIAQVELSMTGVPYTKNNRMDVVLMLDRSSSMYKEGVQHRISSTVEATKAFVENIVINEDGTFNDNRIIVMDFLGGNVAQGDQHQYKSILYTTPEDDGYQVINNQSELEALFDKIETDFEGQTSLYGTEYAKGLKGCYDALQASKEDGNKQFCVFMSDGIPNYMKCEKTNFESTNNIVAMFDVTNRTAANGTASRNATKYEYEYYSTLMKNDGVTVFTVGLGLKNKNSAWSNTSAEVCEQVANMLLNDISGPAGEKTADRDTGNAVSKLDKYFFSVADENAVAGMSNVFTNIASVIKEAATDVVVEDKIGNNYTVNFTLPDGIESSATDGLQDFYIQVVDYTLDATTHDRTGEQKVKENFTFNGETGSLKSHTVDGIACSNCNHVTMTDDGVITKIEGKYFSYESKEDGEYLTWEEEKLASSELALQYFAYLDNSAGTDVDDQVPAGTYYTNEYATLTYKNVNGNSVQQEFPKPQMSWNGAQVSYVFYLVNEAGQPVNRAGRVVPFAEAVYVTDTHTKAVVWNDMEQAAGLEAKYLADELVPEVYALYDNDAAYNIHVYEDETEVNLNNHFIVDGDVSDHATWKNPNTTYVFNNKSDAAKYNIAGTYVSDDGDNTSDETGMPYFCKSAPIEGATYETSVENEVTVYTVTDLGKGYQSVSGETQVTVEKLKANGGSTTGGTELGGYVYYVDENGDVYTIVEKTNGKEVHKGFDFHNTTVAFAVVWKPELVEDTIVIDYGLDVVANVTNNDALASGVVGVRPSAPSGVTINSGTYKAAKEQMADIVVNNTSVATATVENMNSVRFSLDKENSMNFNAPAKFYYESDVNYYDKNNEFVTTSMYSSVTVIPATTVYYEDDFIDFTVLNSDGTIKTKEEYGKQVPVTWETEGATTSSTQDTDRPGLNDPVMGSSYDAENVYGYDSAYENTSTFSLGSARKITVDSNTRGEATFTFYGTGFDVVGMTSDDTGTLIIQVYEGSSTEGKLKTTKVVDTYYGMDKDGNISLNNPDALYQVPVMKIEDLPYGQYTAKITAGYNEYFDHNKTTSGVYDLYLDAIRIYNPTGNLNDEANKAYLKDSEAWPQYIELRNHIIAASEYEVKENEDGSVTITGNNFEGAIFIDSTDENTSIADYVTYGPNNELYLAKGQSVAFALDNDNASIIADVQIALKVGNGDSVKYKIYDSTKTNVADAEEKTLKTATDLYYSIKELSSGTVVITNTGESGILSITNIKVTYTQDPYSNASSDLGEGEDGVMTTSLFMSKEVATSAVMSLRSIATTPETPVEPEEPDTPVTPEDPETPVVPENPVEPEEPETPPVVEEPEEPVVAPAKIISLKTDKQNYVQGDKVKVTVTTNKAATKVKVGNKVLKNFTAKNGNRTWTTTVNATKLGKLTIGAIAYNSKGTATKKVTKVVTVKKFAPRIFKVTLNKNKVKKGQKYTVTVKAGSTVKHVRVNGKKITKFTTKNGVKTFKVTFKANKVGKQEVKVIAYNKALYPTKPKVKTITVTRK